MKAMAQPEVDTFGELIVTQLRDTTLDFFDGLAYGRWRAPATRRLQVDLAALSSEQREVVRRCVVACVDRGIHDFLFALHEAQRGDEVTIIVDGHNVAELSDGLQGELYGEQGWIARFGKYPEGQD
jgi:hypothetical protein